MPPFKTHAQIRRAARNRRYRDRLKAAAQENASPAPLSTPTPPPTQPRPSSTQETTSQRAEIAERTGFEVPADPLLALWKPLPDPDPELTAARAALISSLVGDPHGRDGYQLAGQPNESFADVHGAVWTLKTGLVTEADRREAEYRARQEERDRQAQFARLGGPSLTRGGRK